MSNFYKLNGSKYEIDHDFFEVIDSEVKAYLLGFYVADGNVNEKRKTFRISISECDKEIIDVFRQHISPSSRIYRCAPYEVKGRNNKTYIGNSKLSYDVNSTKLVNSLVKLGYGYNKTYLHLKLPKLPDDLMLAFIRGYLDGDGWITIWNAKEKGKKDRVRCSIGICNKYDDLLLDIKNYFNKYDVEFNLHYIKRDDMYRIVCQRKNDIKKIYDLIYKDAHYFLSRKKSKLESYVNTEILQKTTEDCNA